VFATAAAAALSVSILAVAPATDATGITPTIHVASNKSVAIVSIDATTPSATRVTYRVLPDGATIQWATFVGAGVTERFSGVTGTFSATFDEHSLAIGSNTLTLNLNDGTRAWSVPLTAVRASHLSGPICQNILMSNMEGDETGASWYKWWAGLTCAEGYAKVSYSALVVTTSATECVGHSNASLQLIANCPYDMTDWAATHYYSESASQYLTIAMQADSDGGPILTTPDYPQHLQFLQSSNDAFFTPGALMATCQYQTCNLVNDATASFPPVLVDIHGLPTVVQGLP
jgi:hypothetical protein